jgi:uncharacterized protein YjiS (DUF1127 family)
MQSWKHTAHQVSASDSAPAGAAFWPVLTIDERNAIDRKARQDRAAIIGGWIGSGIARLVTAVRAAHRRRVAMAELSALDSRMLADIGLSRSDIRSAVMGASGFLPQTIRAPIAAPSLNDDAVNRAA